MLGGLLVKLCCASSSLNFNVSSQMFLLNFSFSSAAPGTIKHS